MLVFSVLISLIVRNVAVLGAGLMGAGIVQVSQNSFFAQLIAIHV